MEGESPLNLPVTSDWQGLQGSIMGEAGKYSPYNASKILNSKELLNSEMMIARERRVLR